MKKITFSIQRYKERRDKYSVECDNKYKKKEINKIIDEKTILYLCNQYLLQEYGNRGSMTLIAHAYKKGNVFLIAKNALWAQELWIQREHVKDYVNRMCGNKIVHKIITRVE